MRSLSDILTFSIFMVFHIVFGINPLYGQQNENDKKLLIYSEPKVVKGFPAILKISASGPQTVSKMSLFDEFSNIEIELLSYKERLKYTIKSTNLGIEYHMTDEEGNAIDPDKSLFYSDVPENSKRDMIIDLGTIRPEIGIGTILDDIPPGKYAVRIRFSSLDRVSNSLDIEFIEPSKNENDFLQKAVTVGTELRRGKGINWSMFLIERIKMPKEGFEKLSDIAKSQLQFHTLLSKILSANLLLQEDELKDIETLPVPDYLEPEKQFLILEISMKLGKPDIEEKKKSFIEKYPNLKWRFNDIKDHGYSFLRGAK
jgi:hypothetical protein